MCKKNKALHRRRPKCKGAWRAEVESRIGELDGRLTAVRGGRRQKESIASRGKGLLESWGRKGSAGSSESGREGEQQPWEAVAAAVDRDLARAWKAIRRRGRFCGLCAWWSGSAITTAWESVHYAEIALLGIERNEQVKVVVPRLLRWIERTMDKGRQREFHEAALKKPNPSRVQVRAALTDVTEANGDRYANLRAFRNILIIVTLALAATIIGIAIWHAFNPHFLSLCITSTDKKAGRESMNCLGGRSEPHGADVAMVAALGGLGGLLAIAFTFSEREIFPSRYDPKIWQAFLKPVTGAATALVAILLIQSNLLLKPLEQSQAVFIGYAVLFGFSQQLLTQLVDKRAKSLVTPD